MKASSEFLLLFAALCVPGFDAGGLAPAQLPDADFSIASASDNAIENGQENSGSSDSSVTFNPSSLPSGLPSALPSVLPSALPSILSKPSAAPTSVPTLEPSPLPSGAPSALPSGSPSPPPSPAPTANTPYPTLQPTGNLAASVVLDAPKRIEVEEGSDSTSSFSIALGAEPLSEVRMDFSSESGYLSFDPSEITFDYSNFDTPQVITVSALDNDIDQGTEVDDIVLTSVSSKDDFDECDRMSIRLNCAIAARYANFSADTGVPSIDATIVDDDEAGVSVTAVRPNATYDNFGDALSPALYTIVLDSQPTSEVVVSLSGLSNFSTAEPSSITFEPSEWDTAVSVSVAAAAPTENRPICFSGNRFCSDIQNRTETMALAAESSDPYYSNATDEELVFPVNVVHDQSDPPAVTVGRFSNLLNSIEITFDQDTNRADLTGEFQCTSILGMSQQEVRSFFGTGAKCLFTSDSELQITFGRLPDVLAGELVPIKELTLQSRTPPASLFTRMTNFTVALPLEPTTPVASLIASSQSVGRCDGLTLDSSATSGSGGRKLDYFFTVEEVSGQGVINISSALDLANAAKNDYGRARASVESDAMVPGSTFQVTMKATNFLDYSDSSTIQIQKLNIPAPILSIQGGIEQETTYSNAFRLKVKAELPEMSCVESSLSNAQMNFAWHELTGAFTGDLTDTSRNPRILKISERTLLAGQNYSFSVVASMVNDPAINNTAIVNVHVRSQELVAVIAGGAFRQAGRDASFTLENASIDPDETDQDFTYAWSCESLTDDATNCSAIDLGTESSVTVEENAYEVGTYEFTMTCSKGQRSATTSVTVDVVSGAPPVIAIGALSASKYNKDDGFLQISAEVSSSLDVSTVWSADGSDVSDLFSSQGAYVSTVSNKLTAVVALSLLTQVNTYTLVLTATDSDGSSSYSTVSLTMNESPSSGSLSIDPPNGFALDTAFEFSAISWVDEDLPFTYLFGTVELTRDGNLTDSFSPFGAPGSDASMNSVTLFQGDEANNFTVGAFVEVIDSFGAVGSATTTARVQIAALTVGQLFNLSQALSTKALESGNGDAAKQVLVASMGALGASGASSSNGNSQRRALLAGGADPAAVRTASLEDLWSTYEITEITASDVASLLSVLRDIVVVPNEITDDTATSALLFVNTVLRATLNVDIALTDAASTSVGTSLEYLFKTGIFNATFATKPAVDHASNATIALRRASAAQLLGQFDGTGVALASSLGGVEMYSYRSTVEGLSDFTLALSGGGSADTATQVVLDASVVSEIQEDNQLKSSALLDFKIATVTKNFYAALFADSASTDAAIASRVDQAQQSGRTLLRSPLTVVELSLEGESVPLPVSTSEPTALTLAATTSFEDNFDAYVVEFACSSDGDVETIACPLGDQNHTCDLDAYGDGGSYAVVYTCPKVVPLCLWFDTSLGDFTSEGCTVASGYSSSAVTCNCNFLPGTMVLSANTTAPELEAITTPAPTSLPTPAPTVFPTHVPTPEPSIRPTHAPTHLPTTSSVVAVAVSFAITASAPPSTNNTIALEAACLASITDGIVKDFSVTSTQTARRKLSPFESRRHLLATYEWDVSFVVSADLSSTTTTYASPSAFAEAVASDLTANLENEVAQAGLTSVTDIGTISAAHVPKTTAPTQEPTPAPSHLPTKSNGVDEDTVWIWTVVIALVLVFGAGIGGVIGHKKYVEMQQKKPGAQLFGAKDVNSHLKTRLKERKSTGGPRYVGEVDANARDLHVQGDLRVFDDGPIDEDTLKKALEDVDTRQSRYASVDRASIGGGRYSESVDRSPTATIRRKSLTSAASKDFDMLANLVLRQAEVVLTHP